jgi:hypothetical protein
MDLESITLCLHNNYIRAVAIHSKIDSVLEQGTIKYSTVTRYLPKQSFADSSDALPEKREIETPELVDNAILQALDMQPFGRFASKSLGAPAFGTLSHAALSLCEQIPIIKI